MANGMRMGPVEDYIALALDEQKVPHREIGRLLGRSDKSIKTAVERAQQQPKLAMLAGSEELQGALTCEQLLELDRLIGFTQWLDTGRREGWLAAVVRLLASGGGAC